MPTFPMIHLNGTSAERLREPLEAAYTALGDAYEALKLTGPNGRDYYLLPDNALGAATYEHLERLKKIDAIRAELEAIIASIDQQADAR